MINVYRDLAIPTRRAILGQLLDGPKNVSDVVKATGFKQPNVSNHLAKMRLVKTVRAVRKGREIFYALASPGIEEAVRAAIFAKAPSGIELNLSELAQQYAELAVSGDEVQSANIVDTLIRNGTPLIDLYEGLVTRAMHRVGEMYVQGHIDEGQEHAASAITERMLARIGTSTIPKRPNGKTVLVGCSAGNWHAIGPRLLSDFFKSEGWNVVYLGPNVPTKAFLNAVSVHRPDSVLVSASSGSLHESTELVRVLREAFPETPVAVGGGAANADSTVFTNIGADCPGPSLRATLQWLEDHLIDSTQARAGT